MSNKRRTLVAIIIVSCSTKFSYTLFKRFYKFRTKQAAGHESFLDQISIMRIIYRRKPTQRQKQYNLTMNI